MYLCTHVSAHMYTCMRVCMYVRMCEGMYVCMYVAHNVDILQRLRAKALRNNAKLKALGCAEGS